MNSILLEMYILTFPSAHHKKWAECLGRVAESSDLDQSPNHRRCRSWEIPPPTKPLSIGAGLDADKRPCWVSRWCLSAFVVQIRVGQSGTSLPTSVA